MISHDDMAYYAALVAETTAKLNTALHSNANPPQIFWDVKGKSRLGYASGYKTIHLNLQYAAALGRGRYDQTVTHEVAHIVTTWRRVFLHGLSHQKSGPWSAHGSQWVRAMRAIGRPPERCSSMAAEVAHIVKPARKVTKFKMSCGCPEGHLVTSVIKNKMARGFTYRCRKCHKTITVGNVPVR